MEGSCSTGQSPQWAVVPVEDEEEEEEEECKTKWDPTEYTSVYVMLCISLRMAE
jgi:hypothetical protein